MEWDDYEEAILMCYFLEIEQGLITKKEAKAKLSECLRNKANNAGLTINETFRNENGMDMKLENIRYLFTKGSEGLSSYSKLDEKIFRLYFENTDKFNQILAKGLDMADQSEDLLLVNFSKQVDYSDSTPVRCVFLGEEIPRTYSGWNSLYVSLLRRINKVYPTFFKANTFLTTQQSALDIVDGMGLDQLRRYSEIGSNLYAEVSLNATDIVTRIGFILTALRWSNDSIRIYYRSTEKKIIVKKPIEEVCEEVTSKAAGIKLAFVYWLTSSGIAKKTADIYANSLSKAERFAKEHSLKFYSIYTEDKDTILATITTLYENVEFLELDKSLQNQISSAVTKFFSFVKIDMSNFSSGTKIKAKYQNGNSEKKKFETWLIETGMSKKTAEIYSASIVRSENFAKENNLQSISLYVDDKSIVKQTVCCLKENDEFLQLNRNLHNQLSSAISKFYEFKDIDDIFRLPANVDRRIKTQKSIFYDENYEKILEEKFLKGYSINSFIDRMKFKNFYKEITGNEISESDEKIDQNIREVGIIVNERVYSLKNMLSEEKREQLLSSINKKLSQGAKSIYFENLYQELIYDFEGTNIFSADVLKTYLTHINTGTYVIRNNFLMDINASESNPIDELRDLLREAGMALTYQELFEKLPDISESRIRQLIALNEEFINNGRESCFHYDVVHVTENELMKISEIIERAIKQFSYIDGDELICEIKKVCPAVLENNPTIKEVGFRKYLSIRLKDSFSFDGNIISDINSKLSMTDVFGKFCKSKTQFTIEELKNVNSLVYFDTVYTNSVRINQREFVCSENIHFAVKALDEAIDRFCLGPYIALPKINQFGSFSEAGYAWNSFLLESYVYNHSEKYKLVHSTFNENVCVGAIVKKTSGIDDVFSLFTDALANSNVQLTSEAALDFLCEEGYLARRNFKGIDSILIKVREIRNQRGQ